MREIFAESLEVLSKTIIKILKVNLTTDSYEIIKSTENEHSAELGFSDKISEWLKNFALMGFVHPADVESYLDVTNICFICNYFVDTDENLRIRYRRKKPNGEYSWVMMELAKTQNYSYENQEIFLYVQDVDRDYDKQFEKENRILSSLKTERICMAMIHDLIKSGLWTINFDFDGNIERIFWSQDFRSMLGYEFTDDFPETFEAILNLLHPEQWDSFVSKFNKALNDDVGNVMYDDECQLRTKEGPYRWFRVSFQINRRSDGTPELLTGVFIDIDDQKQHEILVQKELEATKRLEEEIKKEVEQLKLIRSISEIYLTMHVIDLEKNTVQEINANKMVGSIVNKTENADKQMVDVMKYMITDPYIESVIEFTDLSTVAERMKGRKIIAMEAIGRFKGWIRLYFIANQIDHSGKPTNVIFAVRTINEEKEREQELIDISNTDELTGLKNRRAYETDMQTYSNTELEENLYYFSMDLNGLKPINDNLGHTAGDEIIKGAADCIKEVFGKIGNCYRIGGDEFVVISVIKPEDYDTLLKQFDTVVKGWHGPTIDSLSISTGAAGTSQNPGSDIRHLAIIADKLMYEDKTNYYKITGKDRRRR